MSRPGKAWYRHWLMLLVGLPVALVVLGLIVLRFLIPGPLLKLELRSLDLPSSMRVVATRNEGAPLCFFSDCARVRRIWASQLRGPAACSAALTPFSKWVDRGTYEELPRREEVGSTSCQAFGERRGHRTTMFVTDEADYARLYGEGHSGAATVDVEIFQ